MALSHFLRQGLLWRCRRESAILTARWHKMQPHAHSSGYELYVWLDGHIVPQADLADLVNEMGSADIAAFRHRRRSDPYQEARFLLDRGLAPASHCEDAIRSLRQSGYPEDGGLHETGILPMKNTPRLHRMLDEWWMCLDGSGDTRDQLHFDRLLQEHRLALYEPDGEPRVNVYFDWTSHSRASSETRFLQSQWDPGSRGVARR